MGPTSFDKRLVRYEEIHNIQADHFKALIEAAEIRGTSRILDCGCGYGGVIREVLLATERERMNGKMDLDIDLIDESTIQLKEARRELDAWLGSRGVKLTFICGTFPEDLNEHSSMYDIIACKMVLHEVAKDRQRRFLESIHDHLKPGGRLVFWDLCLSEDLAEFYRAAFKMKDSLAGYETMVRRRNFLTEEELLSLFSASPFRSVDIVKDITYRFDTLTRLKPEFKGDQAKLAHWNNFIRTLAQALSHSALLKLHYRDDGDSISFDVRKVIAVTRRSGNTPTHGQ